MSEPPRVPETRKGQGSTHLERNEFEARFRSQFDDPIFEPLRAQIDQIAATAWTAYDEYRKNPRKAPAGSDFMRPEFELPVEWLATRTACLEADRVRQQADSPARVLLICASARSDETCPGEMSKTFRMTDLAAATLKGCGVEVDRLDLSHLTAEFGRRIWPCKACVATAMPLCHWPCSCYPNQAMGQTGDWMNELYPRFSAAHGLMIITPVYWYQAPAVLKLLMDRLVCADGGNPDPTSTRGKHTQDAKALEMKGWSYPRHLRGRAFSVIVHGDVTGADTLRRSLCDWLTDMELVPADSRALLDRYVGYYGRYAESHEAFDADLALQEEIRTAAALLARRIVEIRASPPPPIPEGPRPK